MEEKAKPRSLYTVEKGRTGNMIAVKNRQIWGGEICPWPITKDAPWIHGHSILGIWVFAHGLSYHQRPSRSPYLQCLWRPCGYLSAMLPFAILIWVTSSDISGRGGISGTRLVPEAMFGSIVLWHLGSVLMLQTSIASKDHEDAFSAWMSKVLCQASPVPLWSPHWNCASTPHVGSTVELTLMAGAHV